MPAWLLVRERGDDLEERGDLEASKPDNGELGPACVFCSLEVDGKTSAECPLVSRLICTAEIYPSTNFSFGPSSFSFYLTDPFRPACIC